jgi:hypothetical protein
VQCKSQCTCILDTEHLKYNPTRSYLLRCRVYDSGITG